VPKLYKRAAARRDLVEHAVYLAAEGGEEPEIGSPLLVRDPDLVGIRKWSVKDFENFLIFYLPHQRGVTIVRVLYGRQDWWQMLGVV